MAWFFPKYCKILNVNSLLNQSKRYSLPINVIPLRPYWCCSQLSYLRTTSIQSDHEKQIKSLTRYDYDWYGYPYTYNIQFTAPPLFSFNSLPISVISLNPHRCCSHPSSLCIAFNLRTKNEWNHLLDMVQIDTGHPKKKCFFFQWWMGD